MNCEREAGSREEGTGTSEYQPLVGSHGGGREGSLHRAGPRGSPRRGSPGPARSAVQRLSLLPPPAARGTVAHEAPGSAPPASVSPEAEHLPAPPGLLPGRRGAPGQEPGPAVLVAEAAGDGVPWGVWEEAAGTLVSGEGVSGELC